MTRPVNDSGDTEEVDVFDFSIVLLRDTLGLIDPLDESSFRPINCEISLQIFALKWMLFINKREYWLSRKESKTSFYLDSSFTLAFSDHGLAFYNIFLLKFKKHVIWNIRKKIFLMLQQC